MCLLEVFHSWDGMENVEELKSKTKDECGVDCFMPGKSGSMNRFLCTWSRHTVKCRTKKMPCIARLPDGQRTDC